MTKALRTVDIPATTLPVIEEADVVVVGGGTAGFVAAVAAARTGARTVLVERWGYLAGCLTGTYNTSVATFGDSDNNQVIRGIPWEFIERMEQAGAAILDRVRWRVQSYPETAKAVALDMVGEAGVKLYLHTWAGEALMDEGQIAGLIVQSKSGRQVIEGQVYVDATGDADVAAMAGAPFEQLPPDEQWQTSVDLTVCNVDAAKVMCWAAEHPERINRQSVPGDRRSDGVRPMFSMIIGQDDTDYGREGSGVHHVGVMPTVKLLIRRSISRIQGSVEIDPLDIHQLNYAIVEARRRAMDHLAYLQATVPGYEDAFVIGESHLGVRESRRVVGEYRLTLDDLLNNARFDDVVALNCRALDRHLKGDVFKYDLLTGNHDIPLRALTPQGVENLLVAGRCISSDHDANASLRGAATCMATGHAAGTAAALAAQRDGAVRRLDIKALQQTLREQDVVLSTQ
jgi:ribulose 1,5-bisphosphate synthetase/thiazole synthase